MVFNEEESMTEKIFTQVYAGLTGLFPLACGLILMFFKSTAFGSGKEIIEYVRDAYTPEVHFEPPASQNLAKAEELFYKLFTSSFSQSDKDSWSKLGFEVVKNNIFLIVKETRAFLI